MFFLTHHDDGSSLGFLVGGYTPSLRLFRRLRASRSFGALGRPVLAQYHSARKQRHVLGRCSGSSHKLRKDFLRCPQRDAGSYGHLPIGVRGMGEGGRGRGPKPERNTVRGSQRVAGILNRAALLLSTSKSTPSVFIAPGIVNMLPSGFTVPGLVYI